MKKTIGRYTYEFRQWFGRWQWREDGEKNWHGSCMSCADAEYDAIMSKHKVQSVEESRQAEMEMRHRYAARGQKF